MIYQQYFLASYKYKIYQLFREFLGCSYFHSIEEIKNNWTRERSYTSFNECFKYINEHKSPYYTLIYRDMTSLSNGKEQSYWELGACNNGSVEKNYFIFINVSEEEGNRLIKKWKIK